MESEIVVGLIAAVASIIVAVVGAASALASRNTKEHLQNKSILERMDLKLDKLDDRLDQHIRDHALAAPNVVQIIREPHPMENDNDREVR